MPPRAAPPLRIAFACALAFAGALPAAAQDDAEGDTGEPVPPPTAVEAPAADEPAPPAEEAPAEADEAADDWAAPDTAEVATTSVVVDDQQSDLMAAQAQENVIADYQYEEDDPSGPGSRSHLNQVGLRAAIVQNFVVALKYADGPICERPTVMVDPMDPMAVEVDEEEFCRRVGDLGLDLELSFGVGHRFEVTAFAVLGLEDDHISQDTPYQVGIGLRSYTSPRAVVKGFFGGRLVLDINKADVPDWSDVDVGLNGTFGLQVDMLRFVGLFVEGGVTVRLLRGFYFVPQLGGGLQFRFP